MEIWNYYDDEDDESIHSNSSVDQKVVRHSRSQSQPSNLSGLHSDNTSIHQNNRHHQSNSVGEGILRDYL